MSRFKGYTDVPSSTDLLGRENYVNALSEIVMKCNTPMTISITGEWGSGKTSFVRQLEKKLLPKNYEFIEFNTWEISQFETNDMLKLSLLQSFVFEITKDKNISEKVGNLIKNSGEIALSILLKQIFDVDRDSGAVMNESKRSSIVKEVKDLKNSIEKKIIAKKKRYVIFIDDLDRINPEVAIEILEFLRLFLSVKNCVYLLAIDEKVIEEGLNSKFGNLSNSFKDSRNYFEKLIQLPFYIPSSLSNTEVLTNYVQTIQKENGLKNFDDITKVIKIIEFSIGSNPRRIKRILNACWLLDLITKKNKRDKTNLELLFFLVCFQNHYKEEYSTFELFINQGGKVNEYINTVELSDMNNVATFQNFLNILNSFDPDLDEKISELLIDISVINQNESEKSETLTSRMRRYIPEIYSQNEVNELSRMDIWENLVLKFPELEDSPGAFNGMLHKVNLNVGPKITNKKNQSLKRNETNKNYIFE